MDKKVMTFFIFIMVRVDFLKTIWWKVGHSIAVLHFHNSVNCSSQKYDGEIFSFRELYSFTKAFPNVFSQLRIKQVVFMLSPQVQFQNKITEIYVITYSEKNEPKFESIRLGQSFCFVSTIL